MSLGFGTNKSIVRRCPFTIRRNNMSKPKTGNFCPVCHLKNPIEATACEFCGATLAVFDGTPTTRHVDENFSLPVKGATRKFEEELNEALVPPLGISVYLEDLTPIVTSFEKEFFLGRKIEKGEAGVDLIPFGAFQLGVSRKHAVIRKTDSEYEIIDADSTNGTWLDKQRLVPNQAYPLPSGGIIRMGQMQLIVYYTKPKIS
jgi:hypothetical protein